MHLRFHRVSITVLYHNFAHVSSQVRHGGGESVRKFFNWYYWCVNSGSLLGVGLLSLVAQEPAAVAGGFLAAWGGAGAGVTLALVLLAVGRPYYVIYRPGGSPLLSTLKILQQGISGRWNLHKSHIQRYFSIFSTCLIPLLH